MSALALTMTVEQLRELVRESVLSEVLAWLAKRGRAA